jgi:IS30 family transposase
MGNYLQMSTQQQVRALLDLGWSHRRIAREVGVHRETVGRYARQAVPKPGNVIAGSEKPAEAQNRPNPITGPSSAAAAYQEKLHARLTDIEVCY